MKVEKEVMNRLMQINSNQSVMVLKPKKDSLRALDPFKDELNALNK